MKRKDTAKDIIEKLNRNYQVVGYVTEDNVLEMTIENNLPLDQVDYVCDQLLSMGIIIREDERKESDNEEDLYDRSQIDYERLFQKVIDIDQNLEMFINELRQIKPPQHRECQNLILQAKNKNPFAKKRIVEMYLRVVVKISLWYYQKYQIPLADTIQNGCVGLVVAIDKYDVSRQDNFSTYAPWWIRQSINRKASIANPLVYIPIHVKDKLFSIYDILKQHYCQKCEDSDICSNLVKLISKKLECTQEEAGEYVKLLGEYESSEELLKIDEYVFTDNGSFEEQVFYEYNNKEMREVIDRVLDTLLERERKVIKMRTGFFDNKVYTLEEIGQVFSLTRERIRQIEKKALNRLRHPSRLNKLKGFIK